MNNNKNFQKMIRGTGYDFLYDNQNLGKNIILLGLGGSYAYGTNIEDSDVDVRGIATNSARNILTGNDFEQVVDVETDTTIYSLEKMIRLLCSCNPNVIEILGLKPEHYLYLSDAGRLLLKHKDLFLTKRAAYTFGAYANSQLRRLENKSARLVSQSQQEAHILKNIERASVEFKTMFLEVPDDAIKLYIDKSPRDDYDTEIFCDILLHHYPLRDFKGMMNTMGEIIKSYAKIGKRNEKAIEHNKLGKHMMHLVRLYLMCFDILENGEIITYREKEHDFLMSIRNGEYLDENRQPTNAFFEIVSEYERKLDYLKDHTSLPDEVDMNKVLDLVEDINGKVINPPTWKKLLFSMKNGVLRV